MKSLLTIASLLLCTAALADNPSAPAPKPSAALPDNPPLQMSDDPKMKAEGERLAGLMEKLQKESDPEARRKIMSEVMCPQ